MMKDITGIELHQKIIDRGDKLPVIFITGYDTTETREEAKRTGAIGYFRKSFCIGPGCKIEEVMIKAAEVLFTIDRA